MSEICRPPGPDSSRKEPRFSEAQLRLPLFRPVERTGLVAANTDWTDRVRRFLSKHMESGSAERVARMTGVPVMRVYDEREGRVRYCVDTLIADLFVLDEEPRLRFLTALLDLFGYFPPSRRPDDVRRLEESVA